MLNRISSETGWLAGGGEMGERIRAFDWSKTPVGPIERWPQNLKTAVSICISSRFPIFIWWGRETLTQFYNDAYIPMLGAAKHPRWLGECARKCWKEIWDIIDPMVKHVFATGEATWSEDLLLVLERHLPREECYFTFSYSPIRNDAGEVVGIFSAVSETTSRVIGQRRIKVLRDIADQTVDAHTLQEAATQLACTLGKHSLDLPFSLLYFIDDEHARLVENVGISASTAASPALVNWQTPSQQGWPFAEVVQSGRIVKCEHLQKRFGAFACGPYPESPDTAFLVPVSVPGLSHPLAVLIVGVSSRCVLDESYRTFYDVLAVSVTNALSNARAYEEERRRAEALAELDRAKTAFFSNVSHEFRTPLTLMLGPLEELRSQFGGTESRLSTSEFQQVTMVHRNGLRLLKLVNTLLDFARIEAGRVDADFEPTDLAAFTAELASVFRSAIEKAGLRLVVDCPPLLEAVYVDRQMWEKIVLNLLSNAFKFTFEGEIRVKLRWCGDRVELLVRDTGIGIAEDELPRLFERFHRVPHARARTHEGTGIGLALVQELARLHGGDARVQSMSGVGSTFIVSIQTGTTHLPAQQIGAKRTLNSTATGASSFVEEALRWLPEPQHVKTDAQLTLKMEQNGQASPPTSPEKYSFGARIVLADDNADMREYVRRLLLQENYDVLAVSDGEAALTAARKHRADLILSDIMMPKLDGCELVKQLRADVHLQSIPIILLSARAGEDSRVEGLKQGADDYLIKPFSSRELLARVESNLKLARIRKATEEALRESEERFRLMADNISQLAWIRDEVKKTAWFNQRWSDFTGIGLEDMTSVDWQTILHPDHFERVMASVQRKTEIGEPWEEAFPLRGKDGNYRWFLSRAVPIRDAQNKVIRWFGTNTDVTELREVQAKLAIANAQLASRANQLDALVEKRTAKLAETVGELEVFSYSITHDMRAPLRAMQGFSTLLVEDCADNISAEGKDYLRRIATSANRMDLLIQDVLSYSRIGRAELNLETVDLEALLKGILESYPNLQGSRVNIQVDPLPLARGNQAALTQCFSNLLGNAVKFVPSGATPKIRVWAEKQSDKVVVFVQDNGIGIEKEYQQKIFGIFQRLNLEYDGTGIGLAIVKKAAERMGGKVGLDSEVGKGSTFWLELQAASSRLAKKLTISKQ